MPKPTPQRKPSDEQPLQEFAELNKQIASLPLYLRSQLLPLCERVGQFMHLQNRLIRISQDALDDLQLENSYLQFDLEVTRRERNQLHRDQE